jgi:hypothetical protein
MRVLRLQICGKCIGDAVSRWCSAASIGNCAIKPNQAHILVKLFRLICVVWPILSGVLFAMFGPGLGANLQFVIQLKE